MVCQLPVQESNISGMQSIRYKTRLNSIESQSKKVVVIVVVVVVVVLFISFLFLLSLLKVYSKSCQ